MRRRTRSQQPFDKQNELNCLTADVHSVANLVGYGKSPEYKQFIEKRKTEITSTLAVENKRNTYMEEKFDVFNNNNNAIHR